MSSAWLLGSTGSGMSVLLSWEAVLPAPPQLPSRLPTPTPAETLRGRVHSSPREGKGLCGCRLHSPGHPPRPSPKRSLVSSLLVLLSSSQPALLCPLTRLYFSSQRLQDFIEGVKVTGSSSHPYSCSQGPNRYLLSSSSTTQSRCPSLFANTSAGLHCFRGGVAYICIPKGSEFLLSFWTEVTTVPIYSYQAWRSRQDRTH